jgi:ABC-type uncharacterized transport system substrate-binding protein
MKLGTARLVVPAFLLVVAPLAAEAQAPSKVWRVAVLTAGILRSDAPVRALEQRLAELGYVEGRNLVIDFRTAGAQIDRLPALAAELVGGRPDIFVAVSTQGAIAAKNATRTIPIVLTAAGATLKVGLQFLDVRGPDDLPKAFDAITRQRADGLLVLPDSVTNAHRKPIVAFAASRRLPAIYAFREAVDDGGLMCNGPNLVENFRAAAGYVDKILKGATAGDLPIAQAIKFDLVINLKTAKTLGLTIPPSLLLQADQVIQ